jgi:integrase
MMVPLNPHLFRHSIATHLMGGNINLRIIQKFLGHAQVGTTEWYTHVALDHFSEASAMIDRMGNTKLLSTDNRRNQDDSLRDKSGNHL